MLLNLEKQAKTPLYIQIYQLIKEKIHTQALQADEKLPSKRQLALINDVSENTIMNAYNQLLTEGYIYAVERKGYYVETVDFHYELPTLEKSVPTEKTTQVSYLYDFTRSNPDDEIFPFSVFSKIYRQLFSEPPENLLSETEGKGLFELRESLQRYLSISRGIPCHPDQIILGPSTEYLLTILLQLFESPQIIGVEDPGYHGFSDLFDRFDGQVRPIPVNENGADIQKLRSTDVNLMVATSNHQFPTGSIMPLQDRQKLLQWANQSQKRYIVENDYDSEFKYSGIPIPSLLQLDRENRVIHMGSFTRVLAPALRLSYMVLPQSLLNIYEEVFKNKSAALSTFEQWVIHRFIEEGHFTTHLNRSRTFYKKKRDLMIQAILNEDPEAKIIGEKAGLHLLVQPSTAFSKDILKKEMQERHIKINLLSDFSIKPNAKEKNILFLSFSNIPSDKIPKTVKKIFDSVYFSQK